MFSLVVLDGLEAVENLVTRLLETTIYRAKNQLGHCGILPIMKSILILDNIRSVMNVGSIFRTANALGMQKIYLCGITPGPLDRFNRSRKDFDKVALGADKTIVWEHAQDTVELVKKLRTEGVYVIAVEQDSSAKDYKKITIEGREAIAILMGPEVDGVSKEVLAEVSVIAEIPMRGSKESLNVGVAFGITAYRILNI